MRLRHWLGPALHDLLRPWRTRLAMAVALQAVAGLSGLLPWLAIAAIGTRLGQPGQWLDDLAVRAWLLAAVVGLFTWLLAQTLALHLTHQVDARLCLHIRQRLATHLLRLPLDWFRRAGNEGVASLVEQDVRALHQLVGHAPADVVNLLLVPLAAALILLWAQPWLALFCLVPLGYAAWGFRRLRSPGFAQAAEARNRSMQALLQDYGEFAAHLDLVRLYPAAGLAQRLQQRRETFEQAFDAWVRQVGGLGARVQVALGTPWLCAWVMLGAWLLPGAALAAGPVCLFLLLVRAMAAPVQAMGHGLDALMAARQAAQRLQAVFDLPPLPEPLPSQARLPSDASVRVHGLGFTYPGQALALGPLDLYLPSGSFTALVGPSGAGKSTLASLLARHMDVETGSVQLGGVDLRDLAEADRHAQVCLVTQGAAVLPLTLAENIALYRPRAALADIRRVARLACLDARIMALPGGYDSHAVADVRLSGGECQRLAIARALLSSAPVLVFDEPTSALDPHTERALRQAWQHDHGRTRLVVTHRLPSVMHAEQILVMDQGRIVERGTHAQLLAAVGLYSRLWHAQAPEYDALETCS
ncbi:ABC transporter ATP-binding protein [Pseudomonas putida]